MVTGAIDYLAVLTLAETAGGSMLLREAIPAGLLGCASHRFHRRRNHGVKMIA